jgi:hypothetical protein
MTETSIRQKFDVKFQVLHCRDFVMGGIMLSALAV